jgi:hypothetical protein
MHIQPIRRIKLKYIKVQLAVRLVMFVKIDKDWVISVIVILTAKDG